jgi:hypothetical protein
MSDYRNQCHLCTWRHEDSIVISDGASWIVILHCDFSAWMFWKEELWPHCILRCPGMQLSLYNQKQNSALTGNLIVCLGIIIHKLRCTSTQTWWQLYPLFEFVIQEKGFHWCHQHIKFHLTFKLHLQRNSTTCHSVEGHSGDDNCGWWLYLLNSIQHTIHLCHSLCLTQTSILLSSLTPQHNKFTFGLFLSWQKHEHLFMNTNGRLSYDNIYIPRIGNTIQRGSSSILHIKRRGHSRTLVFHCICRGFVVRLDFHFKLSIVQVIWLVLVQSYGR